MAAKQTTILREAILQALDPSFERWGFSRAKRSFEWFRRPRPDTLHGIHLNLATYESVGCVHVIPTVEVGLEQVERALAEAAGREPAADIERHGLAMLDRLSSLEYLAEALASPLAREWPTLLGRDRRARLFPLVLALQGRTQEALSCFARLRDELAQSGEMEEFGAWFRRRFG